MEKNNTIALAIVLAAGLIAAALYFSTPKYDIIGVSNGIAYQMDRQTGETWSLLVREKIKHEEADKAASNTKTQ
jgi:hypothetical protein